MKKSIFLTSILICALQFSFFAQTKQKASAPSDATTGYTYDFDKANELIIERLSNPTESNKDVQTITEEKSFPKLTVGQKIDADYRKKLAEWVEKNPSLIISTLKNRKEIVYTY
ncbi:MAG: hypothetical protein Q7W45_13160 [Bacteroidota bacterium]|nr:hypothetical protein [Bacteroidota bacterium]MDP3144531.1 hypothetical protein [Bacteroidota bacterium]MDP3558227.1 hypothetical protein [Bacteroidota bacterium]